MKHKKKVIIMGKDYCIKDMVDHIISHEDRIGVLVIGRDILKSKKILKEKRYGKK